MTEVRVHSRVLINPVTNVRNWGGFDYKVAGQIGYGICITASAIETMTAATFAACSLPSDYPDNEEWFCRSFKTLFTVGKYFFLNPFVAKLSPIDDVS